MLRPADLACTCGHSGAGHYIAKGRGRAGPCKSSACPCGAFTACGCLMGMHGERCVRRAYRGVRPLASGAHGLGNGLGNGGFGPS